MNWNDESRCSNPSLLPPLFLLGCILHRGTLHVMAKMSTDSFSLTFSLVNVFERFLSNLLGKILMSSLLVQYQLLGQDCIQRWSTIIAQPDLCVLVGIKVCGMCADQCNWQIYQKLRQLKVSTSKARFNA